MDPSQHTKNPNVRPTFFRFSMEAAETLEDLRYNRQRELRRYVTKRELLEEAIRLLAASQVKANP
jgi:hypothetical protein